jgi:hypothetical protein
MLPLLPPARRLQRRARGRWYRSVLRAVSVANLSYLGSMRALLCLTLFAGFVWAGDLSKIERTIAVAPKYSAEQQFYALLVLGTDMSKKIWFVVDDDTLVMTGKSG